VGGANARAKKINAEQNAKATNIKIKATSDAYNEVAKSIGFTP